MAVQTLLGLLLTLGLFWPAAAQVETDAKRDAVRQINALRLANGAPPITFGSKLDDAAQRHANDMATRGFVDITGSDGTNTLQRITAAGQPAYDGARPHAESVYAGQATFEEALTFLADDNSQRVLLFSDRFREVGIGIASDGVRTYWSIVYGATPNVFPMLINGGAPSTDDLEVTLFLSQEHIAPAGSASTLGSITELRISEDGDFTKTRWQAWQPQVKYVLARRSAKDLRTLFVELRDATGRSAQTQAAILVTARGLTATSLPAATTTVPSATPLPAPTLSAATPEPTRAGPRATSTVVEIKPVDLVSTATDVPAPPTPAPTAVPPTAALAATNSPGSVVTQSRVISEPQDTRPGIEPTRRILFQPRDQTRLPNWVLPVFLLVQAIVVFAVIGKSCGDKDKSERQ